MEPTVELLPVEFQASLRLSSLLWNLSLAFTVCCFLFSSCFRGLQQPQLENWTKVIFPWRLESLGKAQAQALNLGVICVNGILSHETVITKGTEKRWNFITESYSSSTLNGQGDEEEPAKETEKMCGQWGRGKSKVWHPGNQLEKVFQGAGSDQLC